MKNNTFVYGDLNITNELLKRGKNIKYIRYDYKMPGALVFVFEDCSDIFNEVLEELGLR